MKQFKNMIHFIKSSSVNWNTFKTNSVNYELYCVNGFCEAKRHWLIFFSSLALWDLHLWSDLTEDKFIAVTQAAWSALPWIAPPSNLRSLMQGSITNVAEVPLLRAPSPALSFIVTPAVPSFPGVVVATYSVAIGVIVAGLKVLMLSTRPTSAPTTEPARKMQPV